MVVAASAQADVRYAEPGGTGDETMCLQIDPCDIQDAVEHPSVSDGDEIVVLPGIYALGADPIFVEHAIDLHGAAGAPRPTIMTTGLGSITVDDSFPGGAHVRDLKIQNHVDGGGGAGIGINNASIGERLVVESTTLSFGTACALGDGAMLRDSTCSAPGDNGTGVSVFPAPVMVEQASLLNVTAFGGSAGVLARGTDGATATLNAKNVIAEGTDADAAAFTLAPGDTATIVLEYSNYDTKQEFDGGDASVTDPGTPTNQTAAPLLVDPAGGDFHQLLGSPTINAGATDPDLGVLDIDGDPRMQGGAPDIGADEFVPANSFSFGKLKRNKKKGIAFLFVILPGPGEVALAGKGVKSIPLASAAAQTSRPVAGGRVKLKVAPAKKGKRARKIRRALKINGKAKIKVLVTYVPTGGTAKTVARKLKLIKR